MYSLQNTLKQKVREGELWERLDEKRIRCYAWGRCTGSCCGAWSFPDIDTVFQDGRAK